MTTTDPAGRLDKFRGSAEHSGSDGVEIRPLTGRTGAEIVGIDLGPGLTDEQFAVVREALLRHRVVFFRDQHLTSDGQITFARRFGALTAAHPTIPPVAQVPPLLDLDSLRGGQADQWHTDVTFVDQPPNYSFLRAVALPEVGGDTLWANTVAAYESLRLELRTLAEQLRSVHTNQFDYARIDLNSVDGTADPARLAYLRQFVSTKYETEHPVVRVHPETGERALLLGSFVQRVVGYTTAESLDIVRLFQSVVTKPENTVRWHWHEGDVAIWDNRATQHYATFDYGKAHRQMQRVTTIGTVPVGVDGRKSRAIEGDSSHYNAEAAQAA
jgi:alpha-ketoglutarate-dependent sulfate ester dioxygenase